jgi:hypothetical protein
LDKLKRVQPFHKHVKRLLALAKAAVDLFQPCYVVLPHSMGSFYVRGKRYEAHPTPDWDLKRKLVHGTIEFRLVPETKRRPILRGI